MILQIMQLVEKSWATTFLHDVIFIFILKCNLFLLVAKQNFHQPILQASSVKHNNHSKM